MKKRTFEQALDDAYPTLMRAALALSPSRESAEEAVQEAIFRAFKGYSAFRGDSSAATWMCAILLRVIAARAADAARESRTPGRAVAPPPVVPGPDALAQLSEKSRAVLAAVNSLPERQRQIVTLYYLNNATYADVADALGISIGTVKAALHNAKLSLKPALAAFGPERKDVP